MAEEAEQEVEAAVHPVEALIERFVTIYGNAERRAKLWETWIGTHPEGGREILEKLAENEAEERGCSLEEAQARLAVQKLIQDRGIDYAVKYLNRRDESERIASRPLRPMTLSKKHKQ